MEEGESTGLPLGLFYSADRLKALVGASAHLSSQEIIDVIVRDVSAFREASSRQDDLTLMLIRRM